MVSIHVGECSVDTPVNGRWCRIGVYGGWLMEDGVELVFMVDGVMFVPVYGGPCSVSASLWRTV